MLDEVNTMNPSTPALIALLNKTAFTSNLIDQIKRRTAQLRSDLEQEYRLADHKAELRHLQDIYEKEQENANT